MQTWIYMRNKKEGCERQVCYRITCNDYERKEVSMEIKKGLRNNILLPYELKT